MNFVKYIMKLKIEIQYIRDCIYNPEMIQRVKEALESYENKLEFIETLIETNEQAESLKFRGSPTLLINGEDFEAREEPESALLSCRIYADGLPSVKTIREKIQNHL